MTQKTKKMTLIYGEATVPIRRRGIPKSKATEIEGKIDQLLFEYHDPKIVEVEVGKDREFSNEPISKCALTIIEPTAIHGDYIEPTLAEPDAPIEVKPAEKILKPWEKRHAELLENQKNSKKPIPKPDPTIIANLKNIAAGKSVPLDQLFNFEVVSSLPDKDDRIFLDKKGNVMFDKYNPSIFYVAHEDKFLMFTEKGELDKFCEQQLIVLI